MIAVDHRFLKLGAVMLAVLCLLAGCSEEEEHPFTLIAPADIPDSSLPFPDTPDQLLANFRTIYENRDADEYGLILDPAFVTILQQGTRNEFPRVGPELDVAEETRIHGRLFSGEAVTDPDGNLVPAIIGFEFTRFSQVVDWGESLPTDPIPSTLSALYAVTIEVARGPQYSTLVVDGQIRFYVTTAAGRLDGEPRTYFRMVGQLDLTDFGKGVEDVAWSSLKAKFF
jgi:hypothetical protein